jgi:hypothetical protein
VVQVVHFQLRMAGVQSETHCQLHEGAPGGPQTGIVGPDEQKVSSIVSYAIDQVNLDEERKQNDHRIPRDRFVNFDVRSHMHIRDEYTMVDLMIEEASQLEGLHQVLQQHPNPRLGRDRGLCYASLYLDHNKRKSHHIPPAEQEQRKHAYRPKVCQ